MNYDEIRQTVKNAFSNITGRDDVRVTVSGHHQMHIVTVICDGVHRADTVLQSDMDKYANPLTSFHVSGKKLAEKFLATKRAMEFNHV